MKPIMKPIRIARSWRQRDALDSLLDGESLHFPSRHLRGNAAQYASRYDRAFLNFIERCKSAGLQIERTPGPRGGNYSATFRVLDDFCETREIETGNKRHITEVQKNEQ